MEAATLQKKKSAISKGKMKKTMKNLLCRPDPVFWPILSEEQSKELENIIRNYKVEIPAFKKPHWSELKDIPKDKRPKAPKIGKVEGLLFGISICARSIPNGECMGIIIDAEVNPRILVQHVIDACILAGIPVICLKELKKVSNTNFGFPTCCLGVTKDDYVAEIRDKIVELSKFYEVSQKPEELDITNVEKNIDIEMKSVEKIKVNIEETPAKFSYLYRKSKNSRVFNPPSDSTKRMTGFVGQDFIEFSNISEKKPVFQAKSNLNMIVKRITNNPNRIKKS